MAADYPAPKEGDWVAKDFKFHTGETMPELKLHYTTVGAPTGQPVLVLHGSGGSAASMLTPGFAGEMFGPGQPLDAGKYYIIIPDGIGHGKSLKPSDGLKTAFPKYDYADMVDAQYRLVTEGLGIKHLRLVIGNSMGGMHSWIWGERYPQMMDALVPMASQPTAMAARNWMLRRSMIETIRNDPDYNNGNYTSQPRMMKYAIAAYRFASAGGTLAYQKQAPTADKADKMVDDQLALPVTADANDFIYQWGILARLRSLRRHGEDRGDRARDQRGRRRAQSAGNRRHRGGDQADQERQDLSDPGQHGDARAFHHRRCEVLCRAGEGAARNRAAEDDVGGAMSERRCKARLRMQRDADGAAQRER